MTSYRFSLLMVSLLAAGFVAGCGSGSPVLGKATFDGKPIPKGTILFVATGTPSDEPPVQAEINQGMYATASGLESGAYEVSINGFDGVAPAGAFSPNGTALFPTYRTKVDVEGGSSTLDFDVPAQAAKSK